jgi:hypothetical protein
LKHELEHIHVARLAGGLRGRQAVTVAEPQELLMRIGSRLQQRAHEPAEEIQR